MTNEKELNKAYTFGHNKGVKAYYNEQLCTVELPEAVFRYILSLVPTEETEQEPCDVFDKYGNYKYPSDVELTEPNTATSMPCEDAISREAEIKKLKEQPAKVYIDKTDYQRGYIDGVNQMVKEIRAEQKSGKWIVHEKPQGIRYLECPYCNTWYLNEPLIRNSYCPNCGCRMVEPQESETWNGYHGQVTAPKGTFKKIWKEAESEE